MNIKKYFNYFYLKFNQNNEGSWGDSSIYNDIKRTSWAVLGLQKVSGDSEYVEDGEKWIYFNEPKLGWGDIEKNTLAYLAIKKQIKPYLKISSVNEIVGKTSFELTNPTIHNLKNVKIKLSDNLVDFVSYTENLGDLGGDEKINFDIELNPDYFSSLTGELTVTGVSGKNQELTLIQMPVNLVGPNPISIVSGNYSITEDVPIVYLKIEKNIPEFAINCDYKSPFDGSINHSMDITQNDYEILVHNSVLREGNFDFNLDCSFEENKFTVMSNISVNVAKTTFSTIESLEITDLDDFSFNVNETSGIVQNLTFEVSGHYKSLIEPVEKFQVLNISEDKELVFKIVNPVLLEAFGNTSVGDIIVNSDSGYKKRIPVILNLSGSEDGMAWWVWLLIFLGIAFLGLVVFRVYEMKKHEGGNEEEFNNSGDDDFYFE